MKYLLPILTLALVTSTACPARSDSNQIPIGAKDWRVVEQKSGPTNYYKVVDDPTGAFVRGEYQPGMKTTVLGFKVDGDDKSRVHSMRWRWRAVTFPQNGDSCSSGARDSAATVYATWKRGLKWYTIKYVWATNGSKGTVCDSKRNPFVAQDTVILEAGGTPGEWRMESVDLNAEFRKHFENGNPNADVPDFQGLGIMTDGDDTKTPSSADYAGFFLVR